MKLPLWDALCVRQSGGYTPSLPEFLIGLKSFSRYSEGAVLHIAIAGAMLQRGSIFTHFSAPADGDRRGLDRIGGQRRKGLGRDASLCTF